LLKIVERTLREECAIERGSRILLGVSGGGDSSALLHVLARLRKKLGFSLFAHGVDHGLRPEASSELDVARALSQELGVDFSRSVQKVEPGGNLQARARAARYRALEEAARSIDASLIATAHHADDRAETVLLRLLRGAAPQGLGVLPPRSGSLIRPLIRARKSDILAHLARHEIRFAEDPSNANRRYLRVRVRFELLPLMEELSPQIVRHLNALADELQAGPAPVVLDDAAQPILLGRSQVAALRRAQAHGKLGSRVRLRGGREVAIDPLTRRPVLLGRAR
jgi:tRNA(Ile)-lysidine synthase